MVFPFSKIHRLWSSRGHKTAPWQVAVPMARRCLRMPLGQIFRSKNQFAAEWFMAPKDYDKSWSLSHQDIYTIHPMEYQYIKLKPIISIRFNESFNESFTESFSIPWFKIIYNDIYIYIIYIFYTLDLLLGHDTCEDLPFGTFGHPVPVAQEGRLHRRNGLHAWHGMAWRGMAAHCA